mmetsp:Transcript_21922/g.50905  ORF Transcript_21922/g.50905 Transcript_21922/m.50905 type:complete len:219 (-) Transcript_21922:146-802(-)
MLDGVDVPLVLHRCVQCGEPNVVRGRQSLPRGVGGGVVHGVGDLVAALALVPVRGARHVGVGVVAVGASDEHRVLHWGYRKIDLGAPLEQYVAQLREARGCRKVQRGEDTRVQVAVVFALDVLYKGVDVVVVDGLQQRLSLPALARALSTHPDGVEVLELGERPPVLGAVAAEEVAAVPTVVAADDDVELEAARLTEAHILVVHPLGPCLTDPLLLVQ